MKSENLNRDNRNSLLGIFDHVYSFYRDGFKGMVLGKQLWKIILIKLFVMFVILKLFFFPNYLNSKFQTDEEKGNYVIDQLTHSSSSKK